MILGPPWPEAIIVGGGPSLTGFDWSQLQGRTLVAVNDAMLYLPAAQAMFSADVFWAENRRKEIMEFKGERFLAIPRPIRDPIPGVFYLMRGRQAGLSFHDRRHETETVNIHGTSGFGAMNLAVLKGARTIFLLGFDYRHGSQHWYPSYEWNKAPSDNQKFQDWVSYFALAAAQLKQAGIEVYNACPDSLIEDFQKITLDEVVTWPTRTQATCPKAETSFAS